MTIRLLIIFCCWSLSAFSQVKFDQLSVNDGLSQAAVYAFCQDTNNYLWIATRDGLNQYDGDHFNVFNHIEGDSTSLPSNQIWSLKCDSIHGGMWAATLAGVSYYNPITEQFENYFLNKEKQFPQSLDLALSGDSLWISTMDGLYLLNIKTKKWYKDENLAGQSIFFAEAIEGNKLLTGGESGLYLLSKNDNIHQHPNRIKEVKGFYQSKDAYYIATVDSLYKLNKQYEITEAVKLSLNNAPYGKVTIIENNTGELWVSNHGINVYDKNLILVDQLKYNQLDNYSLTSNKISSLYRTHDGSVWVGNDGYGINVYNKYKTAISTLYHNPFDQNSLSNNYASAIYSEDEVVYIGSRNFLDVYDLNQYPLKKVRKFDFLKEQGGRINTFIKIPKNKLLAFTDHGIFNVSTNKYIKKEFLGVLDAIRLDEGHLLLATSYGLVIYDLAKNENMELAADRIEGEARTILKDGDTVWVGFNNGLSKFTIITDAQAIPALKHVKSYPLDQIKSIYKDSKNIIWAGTWGKGLYKFDKSSDSFIAFELNNKLPNKTIYGILEDEASNLWFSTNAGIVCYQRDKKELIQFTINHGLQSNEFNTKSYYKSSDGRMYFGGINGVSYFYPKDLLKMPAKSSLFITNIWINQKKLQKSQWQNETLTLKAKQNNIRVDFTSVSLGSAPDIQFRYKLNAEEEYINIGTNNSIYLNNLSSGEYYLHLNSTDGLNRWVDEDIILDFSIEMPLWKKPGFQLLIILLLILLGIVINRLRVMNLKNKNKRLAKLVTKRTIKITEQNNEILCQNEEMTTQGEMLKEQNVLLENQKEELLALKNSLEDQVEKRTEALKKSNERLTVQFQQMEQFSYITSHNLKGPIASLIGLTNLLPKFEKESNVEIIDRLIESVYRLDSVIKDLGKILEIRQQKILLEPLSIKKVLDNVLHDLKETINKSKININIEATDDFEILGLSAYLYSIFYNLVQNAIKYQNPDNKNQFIQITILESANLVRIEIEDNGIGIDMNYAQPKLFKLFQRFNNSHEGRGVGLYITKLQVELMHGKIDVESHLGRGTTFILTFPLA